MKVKKILQPEFTRALDDGVWETDAGEEAELWFRRYARESTACGIAHASVDECIFEGMRMIGVSFDKTQFANVVFRGCDLSNAVFRECGFHKIRFEECKLVGALFSNCRLSEFTISESKADDLLIDTSALKSVAIEDSSLKRARLFLTTHQNFRLTRDDLESLEAESFSFAGLDLSTCALKGLRVVPETLAGAYIDPLQAMDLIGLYGLKFK